MQIMQMQVCRATARSPPISLSAQDFAERFAIYSPAFWMQALMGSTAPASGAFAEFKTIASNLFGVKTGPLGMLLQGVDTCVASQYLSSGCVMR